MMLVIFTANAYIAQFGINRMQAVKRTIGSSQSIGCVGENQIFGFAKTTGNPYVVNSPKQASSLGGGHSKPTRNVRCIGVTLATSVIMKLINRTRFVLIVITCYSAVTAVVMPNIIPGRFAMIIGQSLFIFMEP